MGRQRIWIWIVPDRIIGYSIQLVFLKFLNPLGEGAWWNVSGVCSSGGVIWSSLQHSRSFIFSRHSIMCTTCCNINMVYFYILFNMCRMWRASACTERGTSHSRRQHRFPLAPSAGLSSTVHSMPLISVSLYCTLISGQHHIIVWLFGCRSKRPIKICLEMIFIF